MAMTPESKVKQKVREALRSITLSYHVMPVTGGYGKSGPPDFIVCISGRFVGIECKANGNKPTALQMKNLQDIVSAGGQAFIVDETSIGVLVMYLSELARGHWLPSSRVMDLTGEEAKD
jgi:hypothetical protein